VCYLSLPFVRGVGCDRELASHTGVRSLFSSLRMDLGCYLKFALRGDTGALAFLFARSQARPELSLHGKLFLEQKGVRFYVILLCLLTVLCRWLHTRFASLQREVRALRELGISHAFPFRPFRGSLCPFRASELITEFGHIMCSILQLPFACRGFIMGGGLILLFAAS
jgi:hypothetical protein